MRTKLWDALLGIVVTALVILSAMPGVADATSGDLVAGKVFNLGPDRNTAKETTTALTDGDPATTVTLKSWDLGLNDTAWYEWGADQNVDGWSIDNANGVTVKIYFFNAAGTMLHSYSTYADESVTGLGLTGVRKVAINQAQSGKDTILADFKVFDSFKPPTGLTGSAGDTAATLTWNAVSGATGYRVYRDGGAIPVADVTTTSYTDTGLTNGVTYSYAVSAYNDTGETATSNSVNVTPMPALPGSPSNFTGSPDDRSAHLSWTAASGTVDGYRIYQDGVEIGTTTALAYTSTGLVNSQTYVFEVAAYNLSGEGLKAGSVQVTPRDSVAPAAPVVTADPLDAKVVLTWEAVPDYDLKHYLVTYSQDGGVTWQTPVNVGTVLTYTVTGLTNGIEYLFAVQAVDTSDNGSDYGYATATPIPPPEAPPNFTATGGEGLIDLRWDAPAGTVEGYRLYRDGVFLIDLTTTTYRDSPLTNGVTYTYSLYAYNGSGTSAAAGPVSAVPTDTSPPPAPTGVRAYDRGAFAGYVVWDSVAASDLQEYRVFLNGTLVGRPGKTARVWLRSGLIPSTSYMVEVQAVDTAGNLSALSGATLTTSSNQASATIQRTAAASTLVPYVSPTSTQASDASGKIVKVRAGRTGFPVSASMPDQVSGQAGSVPGLYLVEVLGSSGTVIGSARALADGSWSLTTTQTFASEEILSIRWRP